MCGASRASAKSKVESKPPVVFLDLDKTLIECNSGWRWILAELRSGRVSPVRHPGTSPQPSLNSTLRVPHSYLSYKRRSDL